MYEASEIYKSLVNLVCSCLGDGHTPVDNSPCLICDELAIIRKKFPELFDD